MYPPHGASSVAFKRALGGSVSEVDTLLEALHEIACTSEEAETVRVAVSALTGTSQGREYLAKNPLMR